MLNIWTLHSLKTISDCYSDTKNLYSDCLHFYQSDANTTREENIKWSMNESRFQLPNPFAHPFLPDTDQNSPFFGFQKSTTVILTLNWLYHNYLFSQPKWRHFITSSSTHLNFNSTFISPQSNSVAQRKCILFTCGFPERDDWCTFCFVVL